MFFIVLTVLVQCSLNYNYESIDLQININTPSRFFHIRIFSLSSYLYTVDKDKVLIEWPFL